MSKIGKEDSVIFFEQGRGQGEVRQVTLTSLDCMMPKRGKRTAGSKAVTARGRTSVHQYTAISAMMYPQPASCMYTHTHTNTHTHRFTHTHTNTHFLFSEPVQLYSALHVKPLHH